MDVVIYHNYTRRFHMNNKLNIKVAPISRINEKDCFSEVWSTAWPLPGWQDKPKDQMIREHITTLTVLEEMRQEPYAIHLEVSAASGDWKSGWMFEGIGITKTKTED